MAKGLVIGLPLLGHMTPLLALIRELVELGDEVVVYCTAPFAARIEETGARFRPYQPGQLDDLTRLPERTEQLSWLLMRIAEDVLEADLPSMRAERADYIVTDSVAPWGQWLAPLLRVPVVTSVTTFAINRHVLAFAAAQGVRPKSFRLVLSKLRHVASAMVLRRALSKRHGVKGPGVLRTVFGTSDLNIVYTSRAFQPCAETFDDTFQFVGPPVGSRDEATDFPWPAAALPLVYVSLGTLFNADATFYRQCFEAFRGEPVQVVMAVGSRVSIGALGTAPGNFTIASSVPQLLVLQRAAAFVTHGGMNSVSESLRFAVPMVTVPQMAEQEIVGRRVEQLGAGVYLAKRDVSPESLRTALRRLLTEPAFRESAERVGKTLVASGGPAKAAALVRAFVERRRP